MILYTLFNVIFCVTIIRSDFQKVEKTNVLIVIVDDLRHLTEKELYLPNIQKIAAKSITFHNAFAQQSLCAPSRNSILTGRRPDALRLYDFYSYWRDVVGNFSTLPQTFKEFGYDTYSLGKVFHPGESSNFTDDYPYSWSEKPYHPPSEKYKDSAVCKDKRTRKFRRNLVCPVNVKTQPDGTLPDLETLEKTIDILKNRNGSKPFFLAVGFHKPHIPLKFPREYLRNIPIDKVHAPDVPYMPEGLPSVAWHPWTDVRSRDDIKRLNISFPYGIMPPIWTLKIRQSYYAAALYIDSLIGHLMEHVDEKNTIIVLTSDHGWSLGENGLWAKYSNFDAALRVPLMFRIHPSQPKKIFTPVELVDIFPTLVELTGLKVHIDKCKYPNDKSTLCFDGTSLVGWMRGGHKRVMRTFAISQYPRPCGQPEANSDKPRLRDITIMGYSVRTKRYRYTEWISFNSTQFSRNWNQKYGIELYDHNIDDNESCNVHMQTKYTHVVNKLSKLLKSHVDPNHVI